MYQSIVSKPAKSIVNEYSKVSTLSGNRLEIGQAYHHHPAANQGQFVGPNQVEADHTLEHPA
jgi:hypothetical protein